MQTTRLKGPALITRITDIMPQMKHTRALFEISSTRMMVNSFALRQPTALESKISRLCEQIRINPIHTAANALGYLDRLSGQIIVKDGSLTGSKLQPLPGEALLKIFTKI